MTSTWRTLGREKKGGQNVQRLRGVRRLIYDLGVSGKDQRCLEWHTKKFGDFPLSTWNTCQGFSSEVASSVWGFKKITLEAEWNYVLPSYEVCSFFRTLFLRSLPSDTFYDRRLPFLPRKNQLPADPDTYSLITPITVYYILFVHLFLFLGSV